MTFDPSNYIVEDKEFPPLYIALDEKDFDAARKLISEGAKLDDLIEEDGDTFLHRAAQVGNMEMIEFFLDHHCPRSLEQFDYVQCTPLLWAAQEGHTEAVVRLLSARANPNARDVEMGGNTALRKGVRGGHAEIASLLLRAGGDPTIGGWMNISAVDQAWHNIKATREVMRQIRAMLADYPSSVRDGVHEKNRPKK